MSTDKFDFPGAKLPDIAPLKESHANGQIEEELKGLFGELFSAMAEETFDASVLGAPHLGSFDLVRRTVNHDGLVLLKGDREEAATRYLYRAWKSGDVQKRGLHFLRTYLQMLFPGASEVKQLWHDKRFPYGDAFILNEPRDPFFFNFLGQPGLNLDGSWGVGELLDRNSDDQPEYKPDESQLFLTSRVEILLGLEAIAASANPVNGASRPATSGLLEVVRAVIPARLVPSFKFWLRFVLYVESRLSRLFLMQKNSALRYPWCGRVISDQPDARWQLGKDGELVALPQPFGTFRLGERRGGVSRWKLHACRARGILNISSESSIDAYRTPKVGEPGRRVDGTWALSRPQSEAFSWGELDKQVAIEQPQALLTTFHDQIRINYPFTPRKLGSAKRLDGRWRIGAGVKLKAAWAGQKLNGWKLGRAPGVAAEATGSLSIKATATAAPERLFSDPVPPALSSDSPLTMGNFSLGLDEWQGRKGTAGVRTAQHPGRRLRLTGWPLGGMASPGSSRRLEKQIHIDQPLEASVKTSLQKHIPLDYPFTPPRLDESRSLDGGWQLRQGEKLKAGRGEQKLDGWKLGRKPSIPAEHLMTARLRSEACAAPGRLPPDRTPQRLTRWPRQLDGGWALGAVSRFGAFKLDGNMRLQSRKMTQSHRIGSFKLGLNELDGTSTTAHSPATRSVPLNGWKLGAMASPEFSLVIVKRTGQ